MCFHVVLNLARPQAAARRMVPLACLPWPYAALLGQIAGETAGFGTEQGSIVWIHVLAVAVA